ncbi:hypothetical protein LKD70_16390 [Ruminococcus sp. CLA-AA-H200]|uniref:Uncharacterized protein n=1 Tax=Ruminococcus turbiniformis TaxID=2881258 RepID=A0ABS8G0Y2_9FIRM|nr:hypothetical protein [Ruminococcus turbiniformis]MCC2255972.1 hypothetical protein [Ruminococcus turbiniformis]
MLILSQDKETIVNFEQAGQIYIDSSLCAKASLCCDTGNLTTAVLGKYTDNRRCREVLLDILNAYVEKSPVYQMPDE